MLNRNEHMDLAIGGPKIRVEDRAKYLVQMVGVSKRFPGVNALENVSLEIEPGKVHAIVGENGAGKSTLMKILAGVYIPDRGQILVNGKDVVIRRPVDARNLGISMIHQELAMLPEMTVAQNIFIGREPCFPHTWIVDARKQHAITKRFLDDLGLAISPDTKVSRLSVAEMQMLEIVRAISFNSDLLIMDEPSSAISSREVDRLFEVIRMSKAKGVAIAYITHKMDEIFEISDVVTVLRDGRHIATRELSQVSRDTLISLMVGREISAYFPKQIVEIGEVTLEVRNLCKKRKFHNVSFVAHRGEIVGIAGLMGAGRTEVAEAIIGLDPPDEGEILLKGIKVTIRTPYAGIRAGIAFVPEDRKLKGLNLRASVGHNITITNLRQFCKASYVISGRREIQAVDDQIRALSIKTPDRDSSVDSLSGGNQQKVVLAKSLIGSPDVFIFDEPTRGIDVGAKTEIYRLMGELAREGKTIIMISSEMPEIIGMSDRVVVFSQGTVTAEYSRAEFDQEKILLSAMGNTNKPFRNEARNDDTRN